MDKLNILFLTDNFPPEVNAPATRTYEHCKEWASQGHNITIITCAPNFPQGKVFKGYKNKLYQKESVDNITVIRVWSYISSNSGFIKRVLDFISYAFMAFIVGLFQKCDIIVGTSPQFFTAVAARFLSFFKRKPWVMEVRDLWPESIAAVGAMSRDSFAFKCLERLEKHLYRSSNKIVVVTNSFKTYIENIGIKPEKIVVITNGVDSSKFQPLKKDESLLKELTLKDKFVIGYIGTHGMAHALDFILKGAAKIEHENVHFVLQGDGSEKKNLIALAKSLNLDNVTFLPFVSKSEIRRYISLLDVALVNLKKSDTFKTVIPSKIFENACMQKPILLGVQGESQGIIESYNAGLSYEPENEESFLKAVSMIKKESIYNSYLKGCENLTKDYERSHLATKMLENLRSII